MDQTTFLGTGWVAKDLHLSVPLSSTSDQFPSSRMKGKEGRKERKKEGGTEGKKAEEREEKKDRQYSPEVIPL